ncbi:MAG TPA: CopG family ribbon-helix-helix protein [Aquella sp.]|nr:CopG family ribbon-helix-helix protein [Aquella sp.]
MATSLKLNNDLQARIQHIAEIQHRSAHWIMCNAIRMYVEFEEHRETFKQEALASWAHYQKTGKHLTGKEVREWLSTWGDELEIEMPKCHK